MSFSLVGCPREHRGQVLQTPEGGSGSARGWPPDFVAVSEGADAGPAVLGALGSASGYAPPQGSGVPVLQGRGHRHGEDRHGGQGGQQRRRGHPLPVPQHQLLLRLQPPDGRAVAGEGAERRLQGDHPEALLPHGEHPAWAPEPPWELLLWPGVEGPAAEAQCRGRRGRGCPSQECPGTPPCTLSAPPCCPPSGRPYHPRLLTCVFPFSNSNGGDGKKDQVALAVRTSCSLHTRTRTHTRVHRHTHARARARAFVVGKTPVQRAAPVVRFVLPSSGELEVVLLPPADFLPTPELGCPLSAAPLPLSLVGMGPGCPLKGGRASAGLATEAEAGRSGFRARGC